MCRVLLVVALLLEPALGQIEEASQTRYLSDVFGDLVEGRPFQARYTTTRSWMSPGVGKYSETESGWLFRDSRGRLSQTADGSAKYQPMKARHWVQDPVTDRFFRELFPDGTPIIQSLSRALEFDFSYMNSNQNSDGPALSEADKRIWFKLPQPATLRDVDAKSTGRKLIEGLDCDGFVIDLPDRIPGGYKLEYWVSIYIQRIIYEKITARNTKQTYRLSNIQMLEPSEIEFTIPTQ